MRCIALALTFSGLLWFALIWSIASYGWDAIGFLMFVGGASYLVGTIWRDWKPITQGEWQDGEPVNYGSDK